MIQQFENFLDQSMLYKAQQLSQKYLAEGHHFRTNANWNHSIVKNSAPVLITPLDDTEIKDHINKMIRKHVGHGHCPSPMIYYWNPGSYIPWHDDGNHPNGAVTIYISTEHDPDAGGYFMYKEKDGIRAVAPENNRALYVRGLQHCVTTVNTGTKTRKTIQCFLD